MKTHQRPAPELSGDSPDSASLAFSTFSTLNFDNRLVGDRKKNGIRYDEIAFLAIPRSSSLAFGAVKYFFSQHIPQQGESRDVSGMPDPTEATSE
jgi:hypothetical protein